MGKVSIPRRFAKKLPIGSFVYQLSENVEGILELPMQYFEEYTLHNENHINAVLEIADALIPNGTLDGLSETAVEILVSAIIVHDLGMFIQREGVQSLLFGEYSTLETEYLDVLNWKEQWEDFYRKARRYNHQQLVDLFGDNPPNIKLPLDTVDDSGENWRVYGEFLRKFHPRLAHDIVLHGFFGAEYNNIFAHCLSEEMDYIKDLIGLVARSHGMEIRNTYKYLEHHRLITKGNTHLPMGVPIYYLMAVLRMADYLHAGTDRATVARLKAQSIAAPVSKNEFKWNQAVYSKMLFFIGEEGRRPDEGSFGEDKGYVEITADPKDSATFLSLENWINSIQRELDVCWAVLSEKYGNKYKLSIHRVVTNIFDDASVTKYNKKFLTKRAAITANPEIAKLLVAPLYGDDPTFAVRELVQNAVDACNERNEWEHRHKKRRTPGKIKIEIDTEQKIFKITDNGIGMNAEVLLNYFLVAGASFRDSAVWTECNKDDNNKTTTMRSGRFGIGALATFLLGTSSTVITRHIDDQDELGYSFSYDLQASKPLDIIRVKDVEIGTQIIIPLDQHAVDYFNDADHSYFTPWYNWYHFKEPELSIALNGADHIGERRLKPRFFAPNIKHDALGWFYCPSKEYTSIHWGYEVTHEDMNVFLCNGITVHNVRNGNESRGEIFDSLVEGSNIGIDIRLPRMSIVDKEGNLGLNISRSEITYFKLEDKFGEELCKYWLAQILVCEPIDNYGNNEAIGNYNTVFTYNKQAFTIDSRTFLFHMAKNILLIGTKDRWTKPKLDLSKSMLDAVIIFKGLSHSSNLTVDHEILLGDSGFSSACLEAWGIETDDLIAYRSEKLTDEKISLDNRMKYYVGPKEYYIGTSDMPYSRRSPITLSDEYPIVIRYKPTLPVPENRNLMLKVLKKYIPVEINQGLIPVNIDERKRMYPEAFKELEKYMVKSQKTL